MPMLWIFRTLGPDPDYPDLYRYADGLANKC